MKKIILFGTGDIAQLAHYYFSMDNKYEIVAFTVNKEFIKENMFMNLPVIDFDEIERFYAPNEYQMFIAISYAKQNKVRRKKYLEAKAKGYNFINYISPKATIYDNVELGENCFIFEDNTIQPFVKIGNNVTLWSGNHIGHHSIIEDHCFITSQVVISGGVKVESSCFIGVNATIRDHIIIKKDCLIGAGAIIMKSTKEKEVYISQRTKPAKFNIDQIKGI